MSQLGALTLTAATWDPRMPDLSGGERAARRRVLQYSSWGHRLGARPRRPPVGLAVPHNAV